ncbi:MAG: HepT-like ribonuclease domain-containing protein [Planctomycetota bacterium]
MSKRPIRIVHEYFGIDLEIIWQILQKDLPELRQKITRIIGDEGAS